jgi:hypothetical protein
MHAARRLKSIVAYRVGLLLQKLFQLALIDALFCDALQDYAPFLWGYRRHFGR